MIINVSGLLSTILKALPKSVDPTTLIGLPINEDGKQIGKITSVDTSKDMWFGMIERDDVLIISDPVYRKLTSMEVRHE